VKAPRKANDTATRTRRNRSEDVIDAAVDVFWRKGFSRASVQDVADEVGVLKGSLYYYIESKEDLLVQIFDESYRQLSALVSQVTELDVGPLERLRAYVERHLVWHMENLERASLYSRDWKYLTGERREKVIEQRHAFEEFVYELLRAAQTEGKITADLNLRYALFFLLAALNGVPDWYRRDGADAPAGIAAIYTDMALRSLGAGVRSKRTR
jgi:AcrR family transcriptional regulator